MSRKRSNEKDEKGLAQDALGLVLSGVGGLFTVSIFLSLLGWQPKDELWTAPVVGLIDALGRGPGLFLCLALAVLGTASFLLSRSVPLGRHVLGILGTTLGLSLCLSTRGGAIGAAVPDVLPGMGGLVLGLGIGLVVLLASVWVTWLGPLGVVLAKPARRPVVASLQPPEAEGVSPAEAAALVASPHRSRELPVATPKSPATDVRLRGGVPQGARPLGQDDDHESPPRSDPRPRAAGPDARPAAAVAFPAGQPAGKDLAPEPSWGQPAAPDPGDERPGARPAAPRPEREDPLPGPRALTRPAGAPAFQAEVKPLGRPRAAQPSEPSLFVPTWESASADEEPPTGTAGEPAVQVPEEEELLPEPLADLDVTMEEGNEGDEADEELDEEEPALGGDPLPAVHLTLAPAELENGRHGPASGALDDEEEDQEDEAWDGGDEPAWGAALEEDELDADDEDEGELPAAAALAAPIPPETLAEPEVEPEVQPGVEPEIAPTEDAGLAPGEPPWVALAGHGSADDEQELPEDEPDEPAGDEPFAEDPFAAEPAEAEPDALADEEILPALAYDDDEEPLPSAPAALAPADPAPRSRRAAEIDLLQPGLFDAEAPAAAAPGGEASGPAEAPEAVHSEPEPEPEADLELVPPPPKRRRAKAPARPRARKGAAEPSVEDGAEPSPSGEVLTPAKARRPAPASEPAPERTPRAERTLRAERTTGPVPKGAEAGARDEAFEELVHRAGCLILEENRVAVSMLERKFDMDFDRACEVLDRLQRQGLIGPYMGGRTRDILLTREEWMAQAPRAR